MARNPKHLQRRGETWYARKVVPTDLRHLYGAKTDLRESLRTKDRMEAQRRLPSVLARWEEEFATQRRRLNAEKEESRFLRSAKYARLLDAADEAAANVHIPTGRNTTAMHKAMAAIAKLPRQHWNDPEVAANLIDEHAPPSRQNMVAALRDALDGVRIDRSSVSLVSHTMEGEPTFAVPPYMLDDVMRFINDKFDERERELQRATAGIESKGKARASGTADDLTYLKGEWVKERRPAPRTVLEAEHAIEVFERCNGHVLFRDIEPQHLIAYKNHLISNDLASATKKKKWSMVRQLLNVAVNNGLLDESPFDKIKFNPADDSTRKEHLSPHELQTLFATVPRERDEWRILRMLAYTGARLGEIVQLESEDFRNEGGILCIRISDTDDRRVKTPESKRLIPVHQQLLADGVEGWVPDQGKLFNYGSAAMSKRLNRRMKKAGIEEDSKTVHSLRHTFKTACRSASIPLDVSDYLAGHKPLTVGQRYGGHPVAALKAAMDKISLGIEDS